MLMPANDPLPLDGILTGLRALAEPTRLRILALCRAGELTVSEIVRILGQSQPRVSRHLKLMTEAGILRRVPEGSWVFYRLAFTGAGAALAHELLTLLPADDHQLAEDRRRLAEVKRARAAVADDYFRRHAAEWNQLRSLHVDEAEVNALARNLLAGDATARNGDEPPIGGLLDIGTGTGEMLKALAADISYGEGVDISSEMLTLARTALEQAGLEHCRVRQADLYRLPFPAQEFHAAVIHQVLHFVADPPGAIAEAARVLAPGGRLLVVDFAPHGEETLRTEHNHRRLGFGDAEIKDAFAASGLKTEAVEHLPGEPLTVTLWLGRKPARGQVRALSDARQPED